MRRDATVAQPLALLYLLKVKRFYDFNQSINELSEVLIDFAFRSRNLEFALQIASLCQLTRHTFESTLQHAPHPDEPLVLFRTTINRVSWLFDRCSFCWEPACQPKNVQVLFPEVFEGRVRCCTACVQKHHALRISNRIYTLTDAFHTVTIGNTFLTADAQGLENARILHTNLACAMARIHKVAKQTWEQEACCRLVRRSATNTPSLVVQTPKSRYVVYECLVVIALPSVAKTFRLDLSAPIALQTLRMSGPALIQQLLRHHLNLTERTALFAFLCTPVDWSKPPSRKRKNVFKLDFECKHSYSPSMRLVACSRCQKR